MDAYFISLLFIIFNNLLKQLCLAQPPLCPSQMLSIQGFTISNSTHDVAQNVAFAAASIPESAIDIYFRVEEVKNAAGAIRDGPKGGLFYFLEFTLRRLVCDDVYFDLTKCEVTYKTYECCAAIWDRSQQGIPRKLLDYQCSDYEDSGDDGGGKDKPTQASAPPTTKATTPQTTEATNTVKYNNKRKRQKRKSKLSKNKRRKKAHKKKSKIHHNDDIEDNRYDNDSNNVEENNDDDNDENYHHHVKKPKRKSRKKHKKNKNRKIKYFKKKKTSIYDDDFEGLFDQTNSEYNDDKHNEGFDGESDYVRSIKAHDKPHKYISLGDIVSKLYKRYQSGSVKSKIINRKTGISDHWQNKTTSDTNILTLSESYYLNGSLSTGNPEGMDNEIDNQDNKSSTINDDDDYNDKYEDYDDYYDDDDFDEEYNNDDDGTRMKIRSAYYSFPKKQSSQHFANSSLKNGLIATLGEEDIFLKSTSSIDLKIYT